MAFPSQASRALQRGQRRKRGNSFVTAARTALVVLSVVLVAVVVYSATSVHNLLDEASPSAPTLASLKAVSKGGDAGGSIAKTDTKTGGISTIDRATSTLADQAQAQAGGEVDAAREFYAGWNNTLFAPHIFRRERTSGKWKDEYVNLPVNPSIPDLESRVEATVAALPGEPYGLLHEAHPPGKDAVMGLAAYPRNMPTFKRLVGGLRNVGYDGHIILGVHVSIPKDEKEYLIRQDVTFYAVDMIPCTASIQNDGNGGNIRGKCSKGLEDLTLEWGRFEMARQWLTKCVKCTGWSLVMDTRDIFFQAHPFKALGEASKAEKDLLFVEEISHHTVPRPPSETHRYYVVNNGRYTGRTGPCYGKNHWIDYSDRPVLCSGTVIGTRSGTHRFLSVLVDEFRTNNAKTNAACKSPQSTDQWTMNYLYYQGRFGFPDKTATLPWGTGPIMTIGHACMNVAIKHSPETPNHSQKDLIVFEGDDSRNGWILNNWEPEKTPSEERRAAAVHQFDRCNRWIQPWFTGHSKWYNVETNPPWKK